MAMQRSASSTSFSAMPPEMRRADDAVAGLELRDAGADRLDHAGHLAARREGPRRLELVAVLDDQQVGIVDPHALTRTRISPAPAPAPAPPPASAFPACPAARSGSP